MNETTAVVVVLLAFFALLALEVPVGFCLGLSGAFGIVMFTDVSTATNVVGTIPYSSTAKYALFVVPMYILLGSLVNQAGIATQIYRSVNKVVGRLPGGLGATTVFATALFSGVSGSSAADVATFGRISVNEMSKHGYQKPYAAAVVAASVAFAALIPPSITIVIYGITAHISIGALILAALLPGILSSCVLAGFIVISAMVTKRRSREVVLAQEVARAAVPVSVGAGSAGAGDETPESEVMETGTGSSTGDFAALLYALILFVIVIGGIYSGIYTATEAGAIGAFAALLIAIVARGSRTQSIRKVLATGLNEAADVTGMVFLLLIGGGIFAYFVTTAGVPSAVTEWALGLSIEPRYIVAVILLLMIPLGMFLDGLSIMLLVVPLAAPVVVAMGFDGIWFGILMLKMIEIGLLTPPVGINVFIISGMVNVPAESVFRRIGIFVALDLAVTAVLFAFPDIVLWLPRAAGVL
jgi:C4-dicarboxylate transporter, DctM subunit